MTNQDLEEPGGSSKNPDTSSSRATPFGTKIIVCFDGTWNNESFAAPLTNVARISRCIKRYDLKGNRQVVYYQPGVGTGTSKPGNVVEGITGRGESR